MRIDSRDCDISCLFVAADLQQLSEKELLAIFESEEKVFPSRMGQKFNAKAPESEKRKPEQKGEKRKTGESTVSFEEEKEEEASADASSWFEGFGKGGSEEEKAKVELGKQRMWNRYCTLK